MKKIFIIFGAILLLASCEQQIVYKVDYNVTLDKSNTYRAGEPVLFNFTGDVDNLIFYSGERGAEYRYKDRYAVPMELVNSAELDMSILAAWGKNLGLSIYISNSFDGLSGDGEADRATMKALYESGMEGWKKLDYEDDVANNKTKELNEALNDYMDNLCIAFHWLPNYTGKDALRTYKINGSVSLDLQGFEPTSIDFTDLGFRALYMDLEGQDKEPYYVPSDTKEKGVVHMNNNGIDIHCEGLGKETDHGIDVWIVSTPTALNKVTNDKGTVIKNLQNYMPTFEYTWNEPGTYTVTFVGKNVNYLDESREVKEFTITILDK